MAVGGDARVVVSAGTAKAGTVSLRRDEKNVIVISDDAAPKLDRVRKKALTRETDGSFW